MRENLRKNIWKKDVEIRNGKETRKKDVGKNKGKTWIGIFLHKKRGLAPDERTAHAERTKKVLIKNVFISCFHGK